ncbi:hypothetical protein [Clostridium sp.]|uniref:hypothetical protein n=1 Tax=Clostridium sp. TaxID=1506 RepID=UPI002604F938|nr:hypothetical protein [Clostridium sp.]
MDNEILEILKSMQSDIKKMDSKIDKNTIMLEDLKTKVETIAEVQKSHMQQNERQHTEVIEPLGIKVDVIELAVKDISKDVKTIREDLTSVELITAKNYSDIVKLKAVK